MGKTVKYNGVEYELQDNEVLAIKVALPRNQRTGKFRMKDFGKIEVHSKWLYEVNKDTDRRKKQGHWGWMTVEDYEKKNFAPYGLAEVAKKMDDYTKTLSLQKENSSLQDDLMKKDQVNAELLARIAELEGEKEKAILNENTGSQTGPLKPKVESENTDK